MVTLYCRADEGKVQRLLAAGLHGGGQAHETLQDFQAVWLQRKRPGTDGKKPYLVSVQLAMEVDELAEYDGSPNERPESEWLIPMSLIHSHGTIKVTKSRGRG